MRPINLVGVGGRSALEIARLHAETIRRTLAGDEPTEIAASCGLSLRQIQRYLKRWRAERSMTGAELRALRIDARLKREGDHS